jgi:hypothetical protein
MITIIPLQANEAPVATQNTQGPAKPAPQAFIWTESIQTILENVRRDNEALEALH